MFEPPYVKFIASSIVKLFDFLMYKLFSLGKSRGWWVIWGVDIYRVPTRTGKPGKMGRHFQVREKSGNFEQTGKVRENHTKYWKTQGI